MKTQRNVSGILLGIIMLSAVPEVRAQYAEDALRFSTLNTTIGAKQAAMGGAGVGIADDYSALFSNPAGLALIRSFEFSAGIGRDGMTNKVTYLGTSESSDNAALSVNNIGIVYPIPTTRGSLTFAFGYGRAAVYNSTAAFGAFNPENASILTSNGMAPLGGVSLNGWSTTKRNDFLDNNIPYQLYLADIDSVTNKLMPLVTDSVLQTGRVTEGGGRNHWTFGGAIDIARNVSLGVSLNFISGTYTYDREFIERDSKNAYALPAPNDFDQFSYISTVSTDISGFDALFGLMYRRPGVFRFGMTVRTPATLEMSESFADEGKSWFKNNDHYTFSTTGETKYKVVTPMVMSGGLSFQVSDWLVLGGDAEYTDWTTMKFESDHPDLQAQNRRIQRDLQATTNLRAGVEVTFWDLGLKIRGGASYMPSPYKYDPPEYDQLQFSGGLAFEMEENTVLNASYALGSWKSYRDNYYTAVFTSRTSESITTGSLNITLTYRF